MNTGGIFKEALRTYSSKPLHYLILSLPGRVICSGVLWTMIGLPVMLSPSAYEGRTIGMTLTVSILSALLIYPITSPPSIASFIYARIGEGEGLVRPLRRSFRSFFPLLGTFIMWTIFMGFGLLLLAFPAFLIYVRYCLAPHAVVIEGEGGYGAMRRGKTIMEGEFQRGMTVMLLPLLVEVLLGQISATTWFLIDKSEPFGPGPEYILFGFLIPLLFDPIRALISTQLYLQLRREKEGLDDEMLREEFLEWEI